MDTFYWHDYETWGVNPAEDKPAQFAGVRTDHEFNVIGEPLNILCKPSLDTLPRIDACLITGLTPQNVSESGVNERDFFSAIHSELARPNTCSVGYNSIRFDDEVTRYGFYRNFYDPYAREWQSGNTRWDIIDMVRLCYAVRPEGFEWPYREDGIVSFKLEKLTQANGLSHEAAHDALSDVYATIAMAKLIKNVQPKLYEHVFASRHKANVLQALGLGSDQPKLHISSKFGSEFACASLILPVAQHTKNKNEILCVDLRYSPEPLFDYSSEELAKLIFTRKEDLPNSIERIPLKSVHINRSPIVLSPGLINSDVAERIKLDIERCEQHRQQLLNYGDLSKKLRGISEHQTFDNPNRDVEAMLYDGFFSNHDKSTMREIPFMSGDKLADSVFVFEDPRLPELFSRYLARNFPEILSDSDRQQWLAHCHDKLLGSGSEDGVLFDELNKIKLLSTDSDLDSEVLMSVKKYLKEVHKELSSFNKL